MTALPHSGPHAADEPAPGLLARTIASPHPDIELGVARAALEYRVAIPEAGVGAATGLVLVLVGYGHEPFGAYMGKLLPYLANRYDCVAASVDYFGACLWGPKCRVAPHPDFFRKLEQHYGLKIAMPRGMSLDAMLAQLAQLFAANGIAHVHGDCLLCGVTPEYNSMGLLPALDGLSVVHRLIAEFRPDRRRLFLLGTSYGGFIAGLMAKLAPNSFRMVVDNSGFSAAADDMPGVFGGASVRIGGVMFYGKTIPAFSNDPAEPAFFSPARNAIRSLLEPAHVLANSARIYAYHSCADETAPTARKIGLRAVYAGKAPYDLAIIDATGLDGRMFKTLAHGMAASLRGIFALSHEKFVRDGGARADDTDFDRGAVYRFACGDVDYVLSFSASAGVRARIAP
jgi:pimeloyl-ACP methyl ester carboxylesterase